MASGKEIEKSKPGNCGHLCQHIVAHDTGGGVALRLATLFPNRVVSLCLMNTVCYYSWPIEAMLQFGHPETKTKVSDIPNARLVRVRDARHFVMLDYPVEVSGYVSKFLKN